MSGKHGSMVLFVRGLPGPVSPQELQAHVRRLIRSEQGFRWLGGGRIGVCDILRMTDRHNEQVAYHGMVEIQPARLALRVMARLNRTLFNGRKIEAHRYRQRTRSADRHPRERRREALKLELVSGHRNELVPALARLFQPRGAAKVYGG